MREPLGLIPVLGATAFFGNSNRRSLWGRRPARLGGLDTLLKEPLIELMTRSNSVLE